MKIWIGTDLHLYIEEPDARHPYYTSRKLGLISDHFASDISQEDLFIFLGDLCDPQAANKDRVREIIQSIPCRKYMCRGNHDTEDDLWYREVGFDQVVDVIRYHNIIFSHKPLHVAPDEINVHGHLHTEILSCLGPNHINAYASNWNDGEHPVLLEDLIDSATAQILQVTEMEGQKLKSQFELYTSIDSDLYSKFLDITDEITSEMIDETAKDIRNTKGFYHLSEVNLDGKTLEPKVPSNFLIDNGYEDGTTKRVCFAPFIDNALTAMSDNLEEKEFYVHVPDGRLTGFKHPTIRQVPDVKITKEIWALSPVKVKCIGKLKVTGYDDVAGKYTYGDQEAELCIWDWEWVDESITESVVKVSNDIWYHMVPKGTDMSQGICSPCYMKTRGMIKPLHASLDKYRNRLVGTWRIYPNRDPDSLTDNEILYGLNAFRGEYGDRSIYLFKYPPSESLGPNMAAIITNKDIYEVDLSRVPDLAMKDFTINDGPGESWYNVITPDKYFSTYDDDAEKHGKLLFAGIPHIAVATKSGRIPPSAIRKLSQNSTLQSIVDFCNWMNKNFQYGGLVNGKLKPDIDFDTEYIMQSPAQFEKSKIGVCWDYVSYEADYFKKHFPNVQFSTYYLQFFNKGECPSHTILTFILNGKHYYFENSFRMFAGVYEAKSEADIINYVLKLMSDNPDPTIPKGELLKKWGYDVWEYNALDKGLFGLHCTPYMNYVQSNGKCWHHTYKASRGVKKLKSIDIISSMTESVQSATQPTVLYHGSPNKHTTLKAQASHAYPDQPAVFATPLYDFALAFAGNPWSDLQINQCMHDGQHVLTEILPKQFDQCLNRPGYIHVLDPEGFTPFGRVSEWTCPHDVKPTKIQRIPNVLQALKKSNTVLYAYPSLPPWIPDRKTYMAMIIEKYHMATTVDGLCQMYQINESVSTVSLSAEEVDEDDTINEILFPDIDSVELWMKDDDEFQKIADKAKASREHTDYVNDSTVVVKTPPVVTVTKMPTTNPNDKVSTEAVKLYFYNDKHIWVGEASISSVDTEFGFLYDVEVFPAYRGKGYGNSIMEYVLNHYSITELTVEETNDVAIKLYTKYGFKKKMTFIENKKHMIDMQRPLIKPETLIFETIDHTLSKDEKSQLAKKYGLTDVGNSHEYDDEKELAEMKRKAALKKKQKELDRKQHQRRNQLKKARNAKKRKAFINKVKSHLPGVKQEEASAVDNDKMDWDTNNDNFFDGHTHMKKFIQESYQFQLVDKVQFFDRLDEAASKNQKYKPVYVVIMHTGTPLSTAIKTVLNSEYSHASISFDSSLTNMYSFARKLSDDGKASHDGGFRTEDIRNKFFQDKEIKYSMYMVPCTEEQIKLMKKRLEYFKKNQSKFTYDFTGLVKSYFHISDNPEYRWFCTRFVADILNAGRPTDPYIQDPFLIRPDDFMETNFAMFVTTGYLNQYNQKTVDTITKRLLNQKTVQKFVQDHQNECVLDFPVDNPYERHVLNFQLSRMDESAVDDFIRYLQSFKIRFDANGDIRITRREYDQLDAHFRSSVKLVRSCMEAGNVEGVKEELYKIHYMIELINQYYLKPYAKNYRPNAKDVRKDMMDLRAVMLSAFKQYLEWVTAREPDYNFQRGYKVSDYGSEVRIPQKLITHVGSVLTTLLK